MNQTEFEKRMTNVPGPQFIFYRTKEQRQEFIQQYIQGYNEETTTRVLLDEYWGRVSSNFIFTEPAEKRLIIHEQIRILWHELSCGMHIEKLDPILYPKAFPQTKAETMTVNEQDDYVYRYNCHVNAVLKVCNKDYSSLCSAFKLHHELETIRTDPTLYTAHLEAKKDYDNDLKVGASLFLFFATIIGGPIIYSCCS